MTKQKTHAILKTQTKKDKTSKKKEKFLLKNLRKGGTVQWDSKSKLAKAEKAKFIEMRYGPMGR